MKGFLFDCTESLGNLHRRTHHIASFAPKINTQSAKYLLFPVQYYRRFIYSKISSKTGGLYQIVAQTKTRINTGFLRCQTAENGLYQNVIKTSFCFQKLRCRRQRKIKQINEETRFFDKSLDYFLALCYNS